MGNSSLTRHVMYSGMNYSHDLSTLEGRARQYAPLSSMKQIRFGTKFAKNEIENVIGKYMKALGKAKLSEDTWKQIADLNRDLLK